MRGRISTRSVACCTNQQRRTCRVAFSIRQEPAGAGVEITASRSDARLNARPDDRIGRRNSGKMIRIGTAGWQYRDWEGIVYPNSRPRAFDPLSYLAGFLRSRRDQFFVLWTAATRCISRLGRACRRSSPAMYPRRGNTRSGLTELNGNLTAVGKSRYGQSHGSRRGRGGRASAASILSEEQQRNEENGGHTRDQSHGTILSWNQDPCRLSQWTDGALSVPMCPLTRSRSPVLFLKPPVG